jgi:hypothetical protein
MLSGLMLEVETVLSLYCIQMDGEEEDDVCMSSISALKPGPALSLASAFQCP